MLRTMTTKVLAEAWPALPLESWKDTRATLHMWMQVVGKVCLALTPRINHFWNIAFHLTPRGLTTLPMNAGNGTFTIAFDFIDHNLVFQFSDGRTRMNPLEPQTVADFYRRTMATLHDAGVAVRIWTMPVEIPDPIRFEDDVVHRSYDPACAAAFWRALLAMQPVFETFRCSFVAKSSPTHFFWGSFDLALTRFSGRRAPERPEADPVTREAYSHEVISHGFWPGNIAGPSAPGIDASFYAYTAPEPPGFKDVQVLPAAASYSKDLSIFILPYEAVRKSKIPANDLAAFLNSTYDAGARLAQWNRSELERR